MTWVLFHFSNCTYKTK